MATKKTTAKKSLRVSVKINGVGEYDGKSEYSVGLRLSQASALGDALAQATGDWSRNLLEGSNADSRRAIIDKMIAGFAAGLKPLKNKGTEGAG